MVGNAESPQWAKNVVHTCLGVQPAEKVLVAVDEPLGHARDALVAEVLTAMPAELWTYTFPNASRPIRAYPSPLLTLMTQVDAIVLLLASMDTAMELPAWNGGKAAIASGNARAGIGAFIDRSILEREMSADYKQIAAFTDSLANRLQGSAAAWLTTSSGTDLRLSLVGRQWRADSGLLRGRGKFGNLPSGEVFIAPVENSAEGLLVIDKCLPGLMLAEPVRMVFHKGKVTHIHGGAGADFLQQAFAEHGDAARVIAELGIGTNPTARLQGNIITDEKALGTVHIAIGRNDFLGGTNIAGTHIDGVIGQPTLVIDGKTLIHNGQHLP